MRWMDYPFYRFLGLFIVGILLEYHLDINISHWYFILGVTLLMTFIGYLIKPFTTLSKYLFTCSSLLFFLSLGGTILNLKAQYVPETHYNYTSIKGNDALLSILLKEQLSSNAYNHRFYGTVNRVDSVATTGKILVLFKRTDSVNFKAGDELLIYDDINDASNGRNPGDFNYKKYLESIDVYGQVYIDKPKIIKVTNNAKRLPWYVNYKNQLLNDLQQSNLTINSRSLVEALVLGQRQNVDPDITKNFRDAGVIHILALSGLHVGIILIILQFLLRWLRYFKYGQWIQTVTVIALLWCFALLTGMSPSILRAVTMFSFIAIAMNIKRKRSVFHSLTISAFFLLLYDPRLLFQVGFQLSYTAVLAIVLLQPLLVKIVPRIKYWLPRSLWQILTVTLAAQMGVAPLSVLYFHQLPMAFLIGNLALLLILPLILGACIAFIAFMELGIPNEWIGKLLNVVFESIIDFVGYISSFKNLIWTDIYVKPHQVILIYLIMLSLILFITPHVMLSKKERFKIFRANNGLHTALLAGVVLTTFLIRGSFVEKDQFLVLHQSRGSVVALTNKKDSKLLVHLPSMERSRRLNSMDRMKNVTVFRNKNLVVDSLPAQVNYLDINLFIIDESTAYFKTDVKYPILLLSNSPKINLDKVITTLSPTLIISDGSNYRNEVTRWEHTCKTRGVNFINTFDYGYVDLKDY